ncbi:MAG: (2Fe-2S)-binding protein [Synergistaceae bacterium]|nr:(2Fe-2S)-binding protein [Synergistaceae bacterium]
MTYEEKVGNTVICRCEEVTLSEIRDWIGRGYDTVTELKHVMRVCMGPCQGRGCRDIIMREISQAAGIPLDRVEAGAVRPPVKPVKTRLLASGDD